MVGFSEHFLPLVKAIVCSEVIVCSRVKHFTKIQYHLGIKYEDLAAIHKTPE